MGEPIPTCEQQPSARGAKRRLCVLVAIGVVCVPAVLVGRHFLGVFITSPGRSPALPRPVANAPFITTPDLVVEKMVEMAQLSEDDMVYDLGCGDGRLVITAALRSGCQGVGIDYDPERVREATENAKTHGVDDRVRIVEQDVYTVDLSKADVVLTYLLLGMLEKLLPQFQRMEPGGRIVTHDFWIHGVEPDAYVELPVGEDRQEHGIYLYTTPLRLNPAMEKGKPPRYDYLPANPNDSR